MKNFLLTFSIILFFHLNLFSQTTTLSFVDFESASGYTTSVTEFTDGAGDYFIRTDGSNITGESFNNIQGDFYFAAQDTDGTPSNGLTSLTLSVTNINIENYTDLTFSIFVAEDATGANEHWDANTSVKVEYQINGSGAYNNLFAVEASPGGSNVFPAEDTNFDGEGDGAEITDEFTEYTKTIGATGTSLILRITMANLTAGDEDIAFDNIKVTGVSNNPQPVTLTFFEAKPTNDKSIALTWQTASEENNDYFSIEHSTDGTSFREIATQVGNGTIDKVQNYSFLHKEVENGLHYYRLKQVDFDGKYEYTNIVTAKVSHSNDDIFLTPNPTSNVILIQTKTPYERDAEFQILNMQGQVVLSSVLQEGATNMELNIADFPVGIYYLQLFVDSDVLMKKIIKQ